MGGAFTIPTAFTAKDGGLTAFVSAASNKISAFAAQARRNLRKIGGASSNLFNKLTFNKGGTVAAGGLAAAGLAVRSFIKEASKIEDAKAAFTPLLGGAQKAEKLVGMLNKTAATTPFGFDNISKSAQQLLPIMNGDLEKTVGTFRMLGDTAGGSAQKLDSITRGFSKAMLKGKVDMESLNMIGEAGVPILKEMAASMGFMKKGAGGKMEEDTAKLMELVRKGKVTTTDLTKTFKKMTSEGGIFFKGMETASATLSGKQSTLIDNIKMTAATIGNNMLPILKDYTDQAIKLVAKAQTWAIANKELIAGKFTEWVNMGASAVSWLRENIDNIILAVKIYIGVLIGLKAISLTASLITNGLTIATAIGTVFTKISTAWTNRRAIALSVLAGITQITTLWTNRQAIATSIMTGITSAYTAAQWLLNAAMNANPIGLVIMAIVALVAIVSVVIKYYDKWGAAFLMILGPFGFLINLIQSFRRNWDMVVKAFKTGGIVAGLKAIGKVILDALLMPLQQLLELVAKLPLIGEPAAFAAKGIEKFRNKLGVETSSGTGSGDKKAVNVEAKKQDALIERMSTNNATVDLNLNDPSGLLNAQTDNKEMVIIKQESTWETSNSQ